MSDRLQYPAPTTAVMRWVGSVGDDLPDEVQRRLRSTFYTSKLPLVVGFLNSASVALAAYLRLHDRIFLAIAIFDVLLGIVRACLTGRTTKPADWLFATGLAWSLSVATTAALVVASSDGLMSIVALASSLGAIGGIVARNHAAPRYALLQIVVIELSYKVTFGVMHYAFVPLLAFQAMIFMAMNRAVGRRLRAASIASFDAEIANRELAGRDPLTGLLNRRGLEEAFAGLSARDAPCSIAYVDLDNFKQVNDTLGHAVGDTVLKEVAEILRRHMPAEDAACRLGGDEFILLSSDRTMERRVEGIIADIGRLPIGSPSHPLKIGASIGAIEALSAAHGLACLLQQADDALYSAKSRGKNQYAFRLVA